MASPLAYWRAFLARPNDDRLKTFGIAILVALASAVVVSFTSVTLQPLQDAHLEAERMARMEAMMDRLPGMRDVMKETGVDALETHIVSLSDGRFAPDIDPANYDMQAAADLPETSIALPPEADIAGIKRRANFAPVHLLQRHGKLMLIVLPVHGTGYQSTIRAMLALQPDLNTVAALTITEQGETPGLGARIGEPDWQALWPGKEIADENGEIEIAVVRGESSGPHQVDGISGATRTGNGITNMLHFWLGEYGYGPLLERLEREGL